ncbi:hypothetical protein CRENBAI_014846 [Crenichthys baileyi]|uniref:Uncharacterized protein n=1 Tax=Crenichthys baileyi TaxID=28760 RepID=A0AAV9SQ15_9TELE
MLPACLRSGFLRSIDRNRMIPPIMELADSRQESARELAPAGPGTGRGAVDLFTFLSREAKKTLRRSAGLSVPQSAFDGSGLAIPCPGTGPLRRRSLPAPLASHSGPALKPSPSSHRKKRRRGAPSCSAGEEVVSLPADVRAAASKPASSPATAPSPRLAAAPPMPSSLTPARCSEATPEELEERLRFFARQIKTFRKTSLMYSSPGLMERIRQMERDYETAVRQFYCRPSSRPGLQGAAAAAEQSTPGLQGAAAAAEQSTPGLQGAAAAAEQPTPGLQPAVELSEGGLPPFPGPEHLLSFLWGVLTELKPDTHHDTPQPDTPQHVSARSDTPQPDTPQPVSARFDTPQPDTPQPVSARSDTPQPDTPQPVSARSDTPQPDTPQPVSARSDTPQPDTPQPVSARSDAQQPDTPQPVSVVCQAVEPDTPQPDTPQPDTPQPNTSQPDTPQPDSPQPDLKSASTSSTRRRGRRKRDGSVHATEGLGDASAPAHATEGLVDASAPAHVTEGPADASAPSLQGFSGKLVLVLASETCDEGFEEEEPPDPVSGDFKGQFVLVLASEPLDEGFEEEAPQDPVSGDFKEQFVLVLASEPRDEGSPGAALASEGSSGSASPSEGSPGAALASEGSALLLPLRVRQAFAVTRLNSVPAWDDLLVARLNSVPARDDLLVARLNSVPAQDDLLVARLNSVPVSGPPAMAPSAHPAWVVFCSSIAQTLTQPGNPPAKRITQPCECAKPTGVGQ